MKSTSAHVVFIVPRGIDGKGGIERLFRYVMHHSDFKGSFHWIATRGDGGRISAIGVFAAAVVKLGWLLVSGRAQIVHINLSLRGSAYRKAVLFALARLFSARVVIHYHGGGFDRRIESGEAWVRLSRLLLRKADIVIALGDSWKQCFVEKANVDPARVRVVYNGVPDFAGDVERGPSGGPLRLLFAGEVGRRKGVDILVEALVKVGRSIDWTCVIAGNGDTKSFAASLGDAGLRDRVEFTGWTPSERIHDLMKASDVVVLPSRSEALPVSLIEAAAASAAMIATDVGACSEIVEHGVNGLIVPIDGAALAAAITEIEGDRERLLRMQKAARQRYLERFTIERMTSQLSGIYGELAGDAR